MSKLTSEETLELMALITQFMADKKCDDHIGMVLVHDLKEVDGGFIGEMSYLSTMPADAAASILRTQSENLAAGRRGKPVLVVVNKNKDPDEKPTVN